MPCPVCCRATPRLEQVPVVMPNRAAGSRLGAQVAIVVEALRGALATLDKAVAMARRAVFRMHMALGLLTIGRVVGISCEPHVAVH
mmetsp:Transcript_7943/g.20240  ORF Transcript_7943/g.20240 Transcript_7943/m.20240 type:complete len:86 (-) Transcript_7943:31-288(-)